MKPYYQDEWVTIYHGDCREILPQLDVKVDLIVTSPPYDDLRDYGGYGFDFVDLPALFYKAIGEGGALVWVVGDKMIDGSESCTSFKQALAFREIGFSLHDTMIYQKDGPAWPSENRYHQCFEYMFVFSKGPPRVVNLIADRRNIQAGRTKRNRWERRKDGSIKFRPKEVAKMNNDGIRWNVWVYGTGYMKSTVDRAAFKHPAIFPDALAKDHIRSWTNVGDTVLDPYLGSGTTAKAAKSLNRKCIGIEIEERYCEIAANRCRQSVFDFR